MGVKGKRKCSVCGRWVDSEVAIVINKITYCDVCGEPRKKEVLINKALNDYIYELCEHDQAVMAMMCTQIKRMKDENEGYKASGILATLKYMYEILDPPVEFKPEYGVANVPYFYYQAKKFNEQYFEVKKKLEEEPLQELPTREVTLKRSSMIKEDNEFWTNKKEKELGADLDLNALIIIKKKKKY